MSKVHFDTNRRGVLNEQYKNPFPSTRIKNDTYLSKFFSSLRQCNHVTKISQNFLTLQCICFHVHVSIHSTLSVTLRIMRQFRSECTKQKGKYQ